MSSSYSRKNTENIWTGVYIGIIKDSVDAQLTGRLKVWIPEMASDPDDPSGWKTLNYCSPFAGATDPNYNKSQNVKVPESTQTSYGFWAIPPDVGNSVLCVFAGGRSERGFWIGCLYHNFMNQMVPGIASGDSYFIKDSGSPDQKSIPVSEYNKFEKHPPNPSHQKTTVRPRSTSRHEGIGKQGLIHDKIRGLNSSTARRESPSQVFGILTPGPKDKKNEGHRLGGNSFVMDDATESEYIGLVTRSGAKIKIDETNELIYIINKRGTSWIQMDADGNVDVFAAESISMRSQKDINIRADRNITMEAGQNIYVKAAKDTTTALEVVEEGKGIGGNIVFQALTNEEHWISENVNLTLVNGNLNIDVQKGNKNEHIKGTVAEVYESALKTSVTASIDIKSMGYIHAQSLKETTFNGSNAVLDIAGNLNTNGSIKSGGGVSATGAVSGSGMFANAFKTPTLDLVTHKHEQLPDSRGDKQKPTLPPTPASGGVAPAVIVEPVLVIISVDDVPKATTKPLNSKTNVLNVFANFPTDMTRKTQNVKTTIDRYPTLEPCKDHINKGGQD